MKKYFIHNGKRQLGPFTAIELIERGITKCTPVFTSGLGRYVTAAEIPVLNDAFGKSIDELKHPVHTPVIEKKSSPFIKNILWVVGALLIIIVPFTVYKLQMDVADEPITSSAIAAPLKQDCTTA